MRRWNSLEHLVFLVKVFLLGGITLSCSNVLADTFKQKNGTEIYHGYATQNIANGLTTVVTTEKGKLELNLNEYDITSDSQGRNNTVSVITIEGPIECGFVFDSIEKSVIDESNKGPRLIVIELDSPGGSIELAVRICTRILQTTNCPTAAFIKSGTFGGAYSAGAAIALACNKIYLSDGTSIGATTIVAQSSTGQIASLSDVVGEDVSAKLHSIWKTFTASLAEKNNHPVAIVNGMEDKSLIILKVKRDNKVIYIENTDKEETDTVLSTFKKQGEVVTLTAQQAVECQIADKVVSSIQDVMADCGIQDAQVVQVNSTTKAIEEFKKINRKFNEMYESICARQNSLNIVTSSPHERVRACKDMLGDINYLIKMKEKYPEISYSNTASSLPRMTQGDHDPLKSIKAGVESEYEKAKVQQKNAAKKSRPGMPGTEMQPQRQTEYR